jgi:hypothetical protein
MKRVRKDESQMQVTQVSSLPPLPLPNNEEKRLMQAEVNLPLFKAVHREMKRRDLTIRKVMEWALRSYLLATNPKEAAKLGIYPGEETKAP